jgi:transcription elongation factor GreB
MRHERRVEPAVAADLARREGDAAAAEAAAAAQGDRSENAEYIYGKKQLREIDRRVRFLRKRLEGLIVVNRPPDDRSRIFFGAWVRLEDDEGRETELRIVGPDEIDPARRYVSMDAPLCRALMRKTVATR